MTTTREIMALLRNVETLRNIAKNTEVSLEQAAQGNVPPSSKDLENWARQLRKALAPFEGWD